MTAIHVGARVWTVPLGGPAEAIGVAGGKGASLARLAGAGLPVPRGFVVCASAFQATMERREGGDLVHRLMGGLDVRDAAALDAASHQLHEWIVTSPMPIELRREIASGYRTLGPTPRVAVRSSALSEDGEAASFAGQQETFLNVQGEDALVRCVQACWASFFSPRALFYRAQKGTLSDTGMAVVVQEMVLADKSGVLFTVDPVRKRRDCMMIEAVFGLGEGAVSGEITPDHYLLDRDTGLLLGTFIPVQSHAVVYDLEHGGTRRVELPEARGAGRVLSDDELHALRRVALRVEALFGLPQDIEWSFSGDELLLLQSRPITTL